MPEFIVAVVVVEGHRQKCPFANEKPGQVL